MADWKVTVPINLPLNTIMAIHNGEGIEAALSELANSTGEGHAIIHDVARVIVDTVNGSAYRITSNSKTTMPPATYSTPLSKSAQGYEACSVREARSSIRIQQTHATKDSVENCRWSSPLHIHIVIRSAVNKDEHFYVTPETTISSLFDSYVARTTVSGNFSWLKHEVWGKTAEFLDMNATIKQAGLKNDAILIAVEHMGKPVTVTFKDAMLRTQIAESSDLALVENLLCSYADDNGHDFENLTFTVNGEWELGQADYTSTLYDCGIMNGDLITVRPCKEEPRYINIVVQDPLGHQRYLTVRRDALTSTLRSQYEGLTGHKPEKIHFSFGGHSLMDGQQLHKVGIGEGSCVTVHWTLPVTEPEFAAPSCPPTSPNLFAPSRLLSKSYVPTASYSGWGDTPCPRSTRWSEWGWN